MPASTVLATGSNLRCDAVSLRDGLQEDVVDGYRGLTADAMAFHFVAMTPSDLEVAIEYLTRFKENLSHVRHDARDAAIAAASDTHRASLASLVSALVAGGPSGLSSSGPAGPAPGR